MKMLVFIPWKHVCIWRALSLNHVACNPERLFEKDRKIERKIINPDPKIWMRLWGRVCYCWNALILCKSVWNENMKRLSYSLQTANAFGRSHAATMLGVNPSDNRTYHAHWRRTCHRSDTGSRRGIYWWYWRSDCLRTRRRMNTGDRRLARDTYRRADTANWDTYLQHETTHSRGVCLCVLRHHAFRECVASKNIH